MTTTPRPAVRKPQQARSRDTEERIVRAATALLAEKPLDQTSVAEIAERAGVSVGGFYARFGGKEDLLLHLMYESYVAEMIEEAGHALDPDRWRGVGIGPLAEAYFAMVLRVGRRHESVLREVVQRGRNDPPAGFAEDAYDRYQEGVNDRFARLLRERIAEVRHPEPEKALRMGYALVQSALREASLFPHMRPRIGSFADAELVAELTRLFCAYLGASLEGTSADSTSSAKAVR